MFAFEVLLNGKKAMLAGFEDWDMLTADLLARRNQEEGTNDELEMSVRGLAQPSIEGHYHHVRWKRLRLSIGDEATIRLVEVSRADAPMKRYRSDKTVQEYPFTEEETHEMQKETYLKLKRKFEGSDEK